MFTLNSKYKLSTRYKIWKVQITVDIYSTVAEDISEKCIWQDSATSSQSDLSMKFYSMLEPL